MFRVIKEPICSKWFTAVCLQSGSLGTSDPWFQLPRQKLCWLDWQFWKQHTDAAFSNLNWTHIDYTSHCTNRAWEQRIVRVINNLIIWGNDFFCHFSQDDKYISKKSMRQTWDGITALWLIACSTSVKALSFTKTVPSAKKMAALIPSWHSACEN